MRTLVGCRRSSVVPVDDGRAGGCVYWRDVFRYGLARLIIAQHQRLHDEDRELKSGFVVRVSALTDAITATRGRAPTIWVPFTSGSRAFTVATAV